MAKQPIADLDDDDDELSGEKDGKTPPKKPVTPPSDDPELPEDPAELRAIVKRQQDALKKANKESAERRKRLDALEEEDKKRKDGELSDTDKLRKERDDLAKSVRASEIRAEKAEKAVIQQKINTAVERAAQLADFEYPDIAPSLINRNLISYDEETGEIDGATEAVAKLLKLRPGLQRSPRGGGTPPRDGQPKRRDRERGEREPVRTPMDDMQEQGGYDF